MNNLTKMMAVMAVFVAVFGCMVIASDDSDAASTIYVDANATEDTATNTYNTLASAVTAAQDGDTITLKSDITTAPVNIDKGVTLNLGGHKIEISAGTGASGIKFSAGSSTVSNGTITDTRGLDNTTTCNYEAVSVIGKDTSVSFSSVTINQYVPDFLKNYNYAIDVEQGAAITLNSGTRIVELAQPDNTDFEKGVDTWGVVGIAAWGARHTDTYSTDVTINSGVSIKVTSFAISGNGTHNDDTSEADYCNTNITINGGDIVSTASQAIYHPQAGNLTVNGGNITGTTGIELRSGNLTITGGTIKATGTDFNSAPNGNGSTTSGVAVVISQHTTALPIDVKISGGSMSGLYALYEVTNEEENNPEVIDIEVTGGDFSTTDTTGQYKAVWTEDVKNFVSGGTFDGGMDENLLAEGVEMDDSGKVVGQEGVTFDVTAAEFLATGVYSADGKTVTFDLTRDYRITDDNINFANLAEQGYESIVIDGNGHTIYGGLRFDADYEDGESQSYSVTISDLNLDGENISDWGYGIVIQNQHPVSNPARTVDFTMTGGSVRNFDSKGIYLINVQFVYIQGVEIENCAYNTHYHDEANEDFKYYVRGDYAVDIDVTGITDARIQIDDVAFSGKTGAVAALKVAQRGGAGDNPEDWGDATIYGVVLNELDFSASEAPRDIMLGSEPNVTGDDGEELRDYNSAFPVLLTASGETVLSVWGDSRDGDRNLDVTLSDGSVLATSCETSGGEHGRIGLELRSGSAKVSGVLGPNMSLKADEDAVAFEDFADESEGGLEIVESETEPELPPFIPFPPEQGGDPVEVYPSGDGDSSSDDGDGTLKVVAVAAAAVIAAILAIVLASTYRKD